MPRPNTAVYLYCVVRSTRRPSLARVPAGLPDATAPAAHNVDGPLWIVAADVPLDVYGPSALEPRLRDLDWVARVALAHEAVVEHFARSAAAVVVPAKLFTMFSTVEKALDDVADRRKGIEKVMTQIAGCEEWGIRVTRQPVTAAGGDSRPASGSAFLLARKAARDAVATARVQAAEAAERAFTSLSRHARDAKQRERRPEPGTNPPVLEAAFLVKATARAKFKTEARRQAAACAAAGADLTLTGPWPAYNFIGDPS
jgi:hypothetical protein